MDYQIQPLTRCCAITGRELKPGERFYSALIEEDHQLLRKDFSPEAWQGAPAGAFSFWMGKVPPPQENTKPKFDDELLEACFHRLDGETDPGKQNFRYVVALLLVRRKRLKIDGALVRDGVDLLKVRPPKGSEVYEVVNPRLSDDEMQQVQDEVFQVLGWK